VIGTIGPNPNTGLYDNPNIYDRPPTRAKIVWLKELILVEVPH
jgi:hypothetical protein